ncbi:putative uncharacterized transposon-derived protein F52C9.6 [Ditylenchus destructor]|uniref:Uncharacterized transposon-derived protein F52C9.6 n=1 Tax=Ditylenchus destructor TaxID=166010 RepID=A0AAD4N2W8_9BILA|nr:putative uncharacterized transposon-derived protein F52C9.6 [Ditylenchus destructor]
MNGEIDRRIKAAWYAYSNTNEVLKKLKDKKLRANIFNTTILAALLYGCETWSLTKTQENRLRTTQRAMERRILGISLRDKITSNSIRQQTQFQDAVEEAKKRKLRWAGHIARREDNRWTKIATAWEPKAKAPKNWGKPLSWKQQITEIAGKEWMEIAQDREKWRSIVNGLPPHQKLATRASG